MGDIINGYELLAPLQNHNAGFSRWTFAKRNGKEYFFKEFINPVYPDEDSLKKETRDIRINECKTYEEKTKKLFERINGYSDGNIVRVQNFFRYDSRYYITMPKIVDCGLSEEAISKLDMKTKAILCRTLIHAVFRLHAIGFVHGDLKPANIIVTKSKKGLYVAKVVDYDGGFYETDPPKTSDDLAGDQIYLSPEGCLFVCGQETKLTTKIDIFALGLIIHQYLSGETPQFDHNEYDYPYEVALDDGQFEISAKIPVDLQNLIRRMLSADYEQRPTAFEAFNAFEPFIGVASPFTTKDNATIKNEDESPKVIQRGFFTVGGDL